MKRLILLVIVCGLAAITSASLITDGLVIQLDAGAITGLNSGDSVTSWADLTTLDNVDGTVSSVDGIGTPTFQTNVINDLPVVRFSGSDLLSSVATGKVVGGATIFAVFTGGATGLKTERLAQLGRDDGAGGKVIGLEVSTSKDGAGDGGSGFRFNNGNNRMAENNPLTTGFHVGAWQMLNGAEQQTAAYYVDGALQTFDIIAQPTNTTTIPTVNSKTILSLGTGILNSSWIGGDYYTGDLAELLIYSGQLSETQITDINQYLMTKYNVPEPATLVLLGLGTLGMLKKRRR